MRIFQNSGLYPGYLTRLARLVQGCNTFAQSRDAFLNDRYGACHFLEPILKSDSNAFFTNGDDQSLQKLWAAEHGLPASVSLEEILLAQIEDHRTEVFYNLDPMRYSSAFVRRLPSSVKSTVAWRAAPSPGADFSAYDRVVCNFPSILRGYEVLGWKTAYLSPAHDPEMDAYAANEDRPIDVLFVGGYSRHHSQRAAVLESVATLRDEFIVKFYLDQSRMTRLAESPLGRLVPPLKKHGRPKDICEVSQEPVFGRDLYQAISRARIVLNGAIDMAGEERGNMRCFEAMGCGALMISDSGRYPTGMVAGRSMITYTDPVDALQTIRGALMNSDVVQQLARAGHNEVRDRYSKEAQWQAFANIVGDIS